MLVDYLTDLSFTVQMHCTGIGFTVHAVEQRGLMTHICVNFVNLCEIDSGNGLLYVQYQDVPKLTMTYFYDP